MRFTWKVKSYFLLKTVVINLKSSALVMSTPWKFSMFCRLLIFFKINSFGKFFQEFHQCQIVWIHIRPDIMSGLILVQTVCKCYQQTILGDKESEIAYLCLYFIISPKALKKKHEIHSIDWTTIFRQHPQDVKQCLLNPIASQNGQTVTLVLHSKWLNNNPIASQNSQTVTLELHSKWLNNNPIASQNSQTVTLVLHSKWLNNNPIASQNGQTVTLLHPKRSKSNPIAFQMAKL